MLDLLLHWRVLRNNYSPVTLLTGFTFSFNITSTFSLIFSPFTRFRVGSRGVRLQHIYWNAEINLYAFLLFVFILQSWEINIWYFRLIGRETEVSELESFIRSNVTENTPASLYVSGAPGTGKTASLSHIVSKLKVHIANSRLEWLFAMLIFT